MSYTTIYYQGGSEFGSWKRALPVATEAEAVEMEASIQRAGRPALYHRTEVWDAIGLPTGAPLWWDFATCSERAA